MGLILEKSSLSRPLQRPLWRNATIQGRLVHINGMVPLPIRKIGGVENYCAYVASMQHHVRIAYP